MATTQTILSVDQLKGPQPSSKLRVTRFAVRSEGTYDSGGRPSFDILSALQAEKGGATAVDVKKVALLEDGLNGASVVSSPNASIALSGTGNKVVTFRINTDSTAGDTGTEMTDTTAVDTVLQFVAIHTTTY